MPRGCAAHSAQAYQQAAWLCRCSYALAASATGRQAAAIAASACSSGAAAIAEIKVEALAVGAT
eukprot:6184700-Pleurochrysis_carterae.AAC.3